MKNFMKNSILFFNRSNHINDTYKMHYSYDNSLGTNCKSYYDEYVLGCGVNLGLGMSIPTRVRWRTLAATTTTPLRMLALSTPISTIRRRTTTTIIAGVLSRLNPILDGIFLLRGEVIPRLNIGSLHSFFSRNFFHRFNETKKLVNDFCILQPYRLSSIKIARLEVG